MLKSEVLFLSHNLPRIENIRHSQLAYAVVKNKKKLQSEREAIIAQLNKMRGDVIVDEFVNTPEGVAILSEESDIKLHMLKKMPVEVELTAAEMQIIDFMVEPETEEEENDLPEGPPVKK